MTRSPADRAASIVSPGDLLGDNRLDAPAGQGGMGVVYRATQIDLDRTVAVKVISPTLAADPVFRERFAREVRLLAAVDHPHVIPIHQAGESGGQLFLSMRWIDGPNLGEEIRTANGLDPGRALRILGQIADALDAVHARGLVHRDIKPSNVLLESRPGGEHAYLTDFGAGRQLDAPSDATGTGQWLGTVDYVAPEILAAKPPSPRSDVYALGCVLFEALAATPPFHRDSPLATMLAHQNDAVPSLTARRPHLPPALDAVLARALAKDPGQRYPTARRFIQAAHDALRTAGGPQTAASPLLAGEPARGLHRVMLAVSRRRAHRLGLMVLILLAGVVGVVIVMQGDGSSTPRRTMPSRELSSAAKVARITPITVHAKGPGRVAADNDGAYVLDVPGHAVMVIDSLSRRKLGMVKLPGRPLSVATDAQRNRLWVGLADGRLLETRRFRNHVLHSPLRLPLKPDELIVLDKVVVAAQHSPLRLVRIDPRRRRLIGRVISPGGSATRVTGRYGSVQALLVHPSRLVEFDGDLNRSQDHRFSASDPVDFVQGSTGTGIMWVVDSASASVLRIDLFTGRRARMPISVGRDPAGIANDGTSVWVTNRGDGTVTRIDEKSGRPFGPAIPTGRVVGPVVERSGIESGAWVPTPSGLLELEIPEPPYH